MESKVKSSSALDGAVDDLFGSSVVVDQSSFSQNSMSALSFPQAADKSELVFDAEGNMVLQTVSSSLAADRMSSAEATTTVNSATCGYDHAYRRPKPTKWSKADTARFYEGLEMYGSDQMLINTMLPQYSAVQIRQKFKAEQRNAPGLFHDALYRSKKGLDKSKFEEQHGMIMSRPVEDILSRPVGNIDQEAAEEEEDDALDRFFASTS